MSVPLVGLWLADVHPSWAPTIERVRPGLEAIAAAVTRLRSEGAEVLPVDNLVLRALGVPLDSVRVLIVGQDPYPTPGHAVGLAFSVAPEVSPLPASLRNIFAELSSDLQLPAPATGDLTGWAQQGVMLLNRVLTVRAGEAGSMRKLGWEQVTLEIVRTLAARRQPLVAILWGSDAQALAPEMPNAHIIASPHPSPLSAHRGFFGSHPFSRANEALVASGLEPIVWATQRADETLW